jgi:hypothetical protein
VFSSKFRKRDRTITKWQRSTNKKDSFKINFIRPLQIKFSRQLQWKHRPEQPPIYLKYTKDNNKPTRRNQLTEPKLVTINKNRRAKTKQANCINKSLSKSKNNFRKSASYFNFEQTASCSYNPSKLDQSRRQ